MTNKQVHRLYCPPRSLSLTVLCVLSKTDLPVDTSDLDDGTTLLWLVACNNAPHVDLSLQDGYVRKVVVAHMLIDAGADIHVMDHRADLWLRKDACYNTTMY